MISEMRIAAPLAEALAAKGFTELTAVQAAVLEPDLDGQDLLVSAQTGSGKTVAFGLAMANAVLDGADHLPSADIPSALIITPTRELALQVMKELQWLYARAGGQLTSCIGGMDFRDEKRALEQGVHIVVGTPGRLVDHIRRGTLRTDMLRTVVLDEADEMLHMGFREELEMILEAAPADRRTLLFSATVSKPIARLAQTYQQQARRINTVSEQAAHSDIAYQALSVVPDDIEKAIINLLLFHDAPNAIVFCARREAVNRLTARLNNRGFSVVALSGEFSQKERTNAITAMRDGRARVCVATDVAARGLDLPGLDLVIHADLPRNTEGLLHRSGRTGRAGRKGVCALIVPVRAKPRTQRLLADAGVTADWALPPSPEDIEAAAQARLLQHEVFQAPQQTSEVQLSQVLVERYAPEVLALAVLRLGKAKQAAPEFLQELPPERARAERQSRGQKAPASQRSAADGTARSASRTRSMLDKSSWIILGVGRKQSADPKWLLPMLCKTGDIPRQDIGHIQIGPRTTHVELTPKAADAIMAAAGAEQIIDNSIWTDRSEPPGELTAEPRSQKPKRARKARSEGKHKPAAGGAHIKAKKVRTGPKKPRGPNGEKKRSPKKQNPRS